MAEVCVHKLGFKGSEPSPYWVRLTLACKKCKEEVVTLVDRNSFYSSQDDSESDKQL